MAPSCAAQPYTSLLVHLLPHNTVTSVTPLLGNKHYFQDLCFLVHLLASVWLTAWLTTGANTCTLNFLQPDLCACSNIKLRSSQLTTVFVTYPRTLQSSCSHTSSAFVCIFFYFGAFILSPSLRLTLEMEDLP